MRTSQLLALTAALATSTMANPVPQLDNKQARDAPSDCTKTIVRMPQWTWGPTSEVWTTTTTSTKYVDCGGCAAVAASTMFLGVGPAVFFTETRTMEEPSTTTVLACAAPTAAPEITPAP